MSLWQRVKSAFGFGAVPTASPGSRYGQFGTRMYLPGSEVDWRQYAGNPGENAIVRALSSHIGRSATEARIVIETRDGEEVDDHPLLDLLTTPSNLHTWEDLEKAWIDDLVATGNAYANVIESGAGTPGMLQYIPSKRMAPVTTDPDGLMLVTHYRYRAPNGHEYLIPAGQVMHFRMGVDPDDQARGISPLAAMTREIAMDNLASRYSASVLRNTGTASIAMSPKGASADDDVEAKVWNRVVEGIRNFITGEGAGRVLGIPVPMDIQDIGSSPDKMALDKIWEVPVARICATFGADPMVIGLSSSNKTYSNLEQAADATWRNCTRPIKEIIIHEVERVLLHRYLGAFDLRMALDTSMVSALLDETDAKVKQTVSLYQAGVITRADARRDLGYEVDEKRDGVFTENALLGTNEKDRVAAKTAAEMAKSLRRQVERAEMPEDDLDSRVAAGAA